MLSIRLLLCGAALSSIAAVPLLAVQPGRSQSLSACEPPRPEEYLLMVVNPTEEVQAQVRNALPGNATATVCTYLGDRVLRIDGFNTPEVAESWAQYVSDASGLRTFVARPPIAAPPAIAASPTPAPAIAPPAAPVPATAPTTLFPQPTNLTPASPAPTAAPASPTATAPTATSYNPQPLGAGYAVLVDFASRPEVAIELRQVLSRDVGLVAYGQRPYLLAIQTPDLAVANQVLQTLSDRNFAALLIDSQSAILLTPVVAKLD